MNTRKLTDAIREKLALIIVGIGVIGVVVLSWVSIVTATDRSEASQRVFSAVLPLLGTWVGTVLAFYFAKENLQAATESTVRLANLANAETPVSEAMIPRAKMKVRSLAGDEDAGAVKLAELQGEMTRGNVRRIPILKADGSVVHVVHESTIGRYADEADVRTTSLGDATMTDLLANPELAALVNAMGFVSTKADLGDARGAMRSVPGCNDVFVTEKGQSTTRSSAG